MKDDQEKNIIKTTKKIKICAHGEEFQSQALIGLIIGDLSIERTKITQNTRFNFEQSTINEEYLFSLYDLFP